MESHRGRRSAFATAFSPVLLLPLFACTAQTDATPIPDPEMAAVTEDAGPTNGTPETTAFVVPETEAGQVLAAAMADARGSDRLLFVHSGADW
jgi:hypothetical protein